DQWLLSKEKLAQIHELVNEQLEKGHIKPSTSPWNAPTFTVPKKSGKWRLLHDLRAVNAVMRDMGALQPGFPSPAMLPKEWPLLVIDLKDCFFTVPLHEDDSEKFAFTVPSVNKQEPVIQCQWAVLPQGMKNSPTICHTNVAWALAPLHKKYPRVLFYHYLDDILSAGKDLEQHQILPAVKRQLGISGLVIAPEKVQVHASWDCLGHIITRARIYPQKVAIKTEIAHLADVQKLTGDIQWARTTCGVTNEDLVPLMPLLKAQQRL
ncbi:hypothetical protein N325_12487, partial [Colius striatus]